MQNKLVVKKADKQQLQSELVLKKMPWKYQEIPVIGIKEESNKTTKKYLPSYCQCTFFSLL